MPRRTRVEHLTRTADQQRKALDRTQLQIAAATRPADGPKITDPKWRWVEKLMAQRTADLDGPGVLGFGMSFRRRADVPTDEPCLTVYVKKKRTPAQLRKRDEKALPRSITSGKRRLRVDVVELGPLERYTTLGESVGPRRPKGSATLGALAVDQTTGRVVAITAQHMTGLSELPQGSVQRVPVFVPSVGKQGSALYGDVTAGSMIGIDACKIDLRNQRGTEPRIPFIGEVRGWRPVRVPGDRNLPVRMYGEVSGLQTGFIDTPLIALPKFRLDAAILVHMFAQRGDSGAALVDEHNLVLATLVGQAGRFQVFCAIGETLQRLNCDIPTVRN